LNIEVSFRPFSLEGPDPKRNSLSGEANGVGNALGFGDSATYSAFTTIDIFLNTKKTSISLVVHSRLAWSRCLPRLAYEDSSDA
jgi:hypothetical protein